MFWLTRDYRTKEALGVFEDKEIRAGIIEAPNGVHTGRIDRNDDGSYTVSSRLKSEDVRLGDILWEYRMTLEPISEAEYQTYLEFKIFPETS